MKPNYSNLRTSLTLTFASAMLMCIFTNTAYAQLMIFNSESSSKILGVSPLFHQQLHYGPGHFDFNALPVYLETNPEGTVGFRFYPYLNVSVRKERSLFVNNLGVGFAVPVCVYGSDFTKTHGHHVYLTPGTDILFRKNEGFADLEFNLYLEPGYSLRIKQIKGLQIGFPIGKTLELRGEDLTLVPYYAIRLSWYWILF